MARGSALSYIPSPGKGYVQGAESVQRMFAALPQALVDELRPEINAAADEFIARYKEVAPVSELEPHPGALRDSAHKEPGRTELSIAVVVDAKDTKGRFFPAHAEYGHKAADGSHVAGVPAFWPVYAVLRKKTRSRFSRAVNKAVKKVAAVGGDGVG